MTLDTSPLMAQAAMPMKTSMLSKPPPGLDIPNGGAVGSHPSTSPSPRANLTLEERLSLATHRREEFRAWVLNKARSKKNLTRTDDRKQRLLRLKERQDAAELARDRLLEEVRQKAASVGFKRETALARVSKRQGDLAHKVAQSLSAAEERRNALLEAERERLRAEHSLVLTRLALSKDEPEAARRRLEERLALAEEQRQQRLAQAATRAGSQVLHAKAVSALTKQLAKQQAVERLESLQARLESAEARRLAGRGPLSPRSPRMPRVSVNGSMCITSPPLTAEPSSAGNDDASEPTSPPMRPASLPRPPLSPVSLSQQVSTRLLAEVGTLVELAQHEPALTPRTAVPKSATTTALQVEAVREARLEELRRSASTRRLQAAWRAFSRKHRTTAALCQAFVDTGVIQVGPVSRSASMSGEPAAPFASPADVHSPPGAVVVGVMSSPPRAPRGADEFDAFAKMVQSPATLRAGSVLLRRLESRLLLQGGVDGSAKPVTANGASASTQNTAASGHHHHKAGTMNGGSVAGVGSGKRVAGSGSSGAHVTGGASERNVARVLRRLYPELPKDRRPDRYPPRILLCSLMIIHHPEVVFNGTGDREPKLAAAAKEMIHKFERLIARILAPPATPSLRPSSAGNAPLPPAPALSASPVAVGMHNYFRAMKEAGHAHGSGGSGAYVTIGQRLVEFDEAWLQYLDQFAAWKLEDAASLESELIRVAAEMERSLQRKLVRSATSSPTNTPPRSARNLDNLVAQVRHDYELLRERVERLSGAPGIARLDAALQAVREQVALESASEVETESEVENATRTSSPTNGQGAGRPARPSGGIKRGFFSSPGSNPGTPPRRASAVATPGSASPNPHAGLTAGSPLTPRSPQYPPPSPGKPRQVAQPVQRPSEVQVSDVRAPSVPRSPIASSGAASPTVPMSPSQAAQDASGSAAVSESIANLQMVWELVHNPGYRMPAAEAEAAWARACAPTGTPLASLDPEELEVLSGEALAGTLREHARAVAEAVFWDSMAARIREGLQSSSDGLQDTVAPLIGELGRDLADIISQPAMRTMLQTEFAEPSVREALGGSGAPAVTSLAPLAGRLQRLATLLIENGAPARDEEVRAAHGAIAAELGVAIPTAIAALGGGAGEGAEEAVSRLSVCVARALRVLLAQLKLLKLDAANGRLAALYQQVKGGAGVTYLRTKFGALHALPTDWDAANTVSDSGSGNATLDATALRYTIGQRLPRTTAWLSRAAAAAPGIHGYLTTAGLDVDADQLQAAAREAAAAAAAAAAVPATLRAGLRSPGRSGSGVPTAPTPHPLPPCMLRTWRGLVRTGLIALVSSDKPAVGPTLGETLAWDAERLHAAQNTFQQLVVVTAGLLLVQQTRARGGRPPLPPAQLEGARRRVLVVLADPSMSLQGLVSELYRLVSGPPGTALTTVAPSSTPPAADRDTHSATVAPAVAGNGGESAAAAATAAAAGDALTDEVALGAAFRALMNPASAAFTSISNALAGALALHLLLGASAVTADAGGAGRGLAVLLGRVGAGALAGDVAALAKQLSAMCAISEVVFQPVYERLMEAGTL